MAKTSLIVESEGFERLASAMDEVISKGEKISGGLSAINEASTKGAKEAVEAQRAFGASVAQTASEFEQMGALAKLGLAELKRNQGQVLKDSKAVFDLVRKRVISEKQGVEEVKKMAKEYAQMEKEVNDLTKALQKSAEQTLSIQQRVRQAERDAGLAAEQFGRFSPEFQAAAQKAASLKDELERVKLAVEQIQPEKKLETIGNLATSIAGGFSVIQGIVALAGDTSDATAQKLLKVQAALSTVQGLQAFFTSFSATVKSLAGWLSTATTASTTLTTAQGATAAATTATTAATTAQAGATGVLTGAIRTLTAAMVANPILAAAAVLSAIAVAVVALGDDSEETKGKVDDLITSLERMQKVREILAERQKIQTDFQRELEDLVQGEIDLNAELVKLDTRKAEDLARNAKKVNDTRRDQVITYSTLVGAVKDLDKDLIGSAQKVQTALQQAGDDVGEKFKALDELSKDAAKELSGDELALVDQVIGKLREQVTAEEALLNDRLSINARFQLAIAAAIKEQAEKDKKDREDRIKREREELQFRLKLQNDFLKLSNDLAQKALDSGRAREIAELEIQAQEAKNNALFDREREFRNKILDIREEEEQKNIDQIQRALQEQLALQELYNRIGLEKFKELSDEQRRIRVEAILAEEKLKLTPEQITYLEQLRADVAAKFGRERTQNFIRESEDRIAQDKKEQGELLASIKLQEDFAKAQLDNADGNANAIDTILLENGIRQTKRTEDAERAKLLVAIKYAKQRLLLLQASGEKEDAVLAEQLQKFISQAEADLQRSPKFDLGKLLGLTEADMQVIQGAFQNLMTFYQEFEDQRLQAEIDANERYLNSLDERLGVVRDRLRQEESLREQGLANNVERERAAEDEILKLKEKAAQDQARLAQRERTSQKVIQAANLASAIAALLNSGAKGGILGLGIAAAAIPFLYSLFNKGKAQAEASAYFDGTPYAERNGAPKGRDTIPAMIHEGERIVPTRENLKYWNVYEGLRKNDPGQLASGLLDMPWADAVLSKITRQVAPVAMPVNMRLPERLQSVSDQAQQARMERMMDNPVMIGYMEKIAETNAEMLRREMTRQNIVFDPSTGDKIIEQGGNTVTIKNPSREFER